MASYPTAVKSFTTKSNGNTIQPSHINDLQDEVNAIEAGLLNGTANLNSSGSTLASLSVTGGSTLATLNVSGVSTLATLSVSGASTLTGNVHAAGALQVDGNSTIAGNLTVVGTLTASLTQPYVRLTHSAKQDVANATYTGLNFDTEADDASNLHSTSVNSSRITFGSSGSWLIGASVAFAFESGGNRLLRLLVNDTTTIGVQSCPGPPTNIQTWLTCTTEYRAASSADYVTVVVYQDSGSTCSVSSHAGVNGTLPCYFWAQRISQ